MASSAQHSMTSSLPPLFKPKSPQNQIQHLTSLIHASASPLHLKQIHAHLLRSPHLSLSLPLLSHHLISSPHSSPSYSLSLFRHHSPSPPSSPLFTSLIRSLSSPLPHSALDHFRLLLRHGLRPSHLSLSFSLRSAAALRSTPAASSLHTLALKRSLDVDTFVRTTLADSYVKLGLPSLALQLFDETPHWHKDANTILWNVAIKGSCELGDMELARKLFDEMPDRKVSTWNCLIDGYVKRGDVESAVRVFEEMTGRDVVSWTTVVVGFLHNGDAKRALDMFDRMMEGGVRPNSYTLCSALAACAKIGAVEAGIRIHDYVSRSGIRVNGAIGTALVDMYSKCGKIENAGRVFDEMKDRDVLAYTAMINGWGIHGRWQEALRCFEDMKCYIAEPDDGAFLAALVACQHSGKVEFGLKIFDSMRHEYKTEPTLKHYTSILNLLGRAGRFNEALDLLNSMPIEPDFVLWGALFNACQAHSNVELAELATTKLLTLKPIHSGGYVFLSNVYAGSGRWEDAERVRIDMKSCCVEKSPGWSCIEIAGKSHQFVAGDQSHPQSREIYEKLEEMVSRARALGYKPSTEWVLHNIEEEDKEDSLGWHSEKLALALGLLSTVEGEEITIVKNLRVCGDCHSLMKLVSKLYGRVIILRDIKRFHQFKDRECSCGDYW